MIWGLAIEPGQMYSCTLEEEVHLSLAALESRPETDEKTSKYSQVVLKTKDSQQLLCTLVQGTIFQQSLDLKLMPRESVSFSVQGSGVVYITGYSYSSPVDGEGEEDSGEFNTSQELQEETEVELQEDEERYDDEEISMDIQIKGEPVSTPQEELYEKGEHSISDAGNTIEQNASVPENRLMDVPVPEEATQLGNKHTVAGLDDLEEPNLPQTSDSGWLNETSYPTQVGVSDRPAERTTSHNPSPAGNERSFNEVPGTSRSGWVNSRMTSYPQQGEQVYSQPARNLGGQRSATMPRDLGRKRSHKSVDGSRSGKEMRRKKVCPKKVVSTTVVHSSSKTKLPAQAVVPIALVRKEQPTQATLPSKGGAVHVRLEGALLSPHSPTPPPVFLTPVAPTQQSPLTSNMQQTMPAGHHIQPAPPMVVYQATHSVAPTSSQQGLNYMETPQVANILNYDLPSTHSQANQMAYFSTLGALTEKVNVMEQTMVKLTEVLTKLNGKPLKTSKVPTPIYVDNMDGSVQVGDENDKITLNKKEVDGAFSLSLTGKDFVLKMMSIAFTAEELAASNYSGGRTICGSEIKHKMALIDHWKFKAILASAECNFPGCTDGHMLKVLKDAVNNKCRKVDGKMKNM